MCQTNQSRKLSSLCDLGRPLVCQALEEASLPPAGAHFGEAFPPLLLGRGPWVVGRTHTLQPRVEEDEASTTVRVGRCKEHADARARRTCPQNGAVRADRVHDRADVIHGGLRRLHFSHPIRETRAPLVEHEYAAAVGEPLDVSHEERLVPRRDQIACNAAHEHDIRRTRAYDLIRDRDVAATCVAHVWESHGRSLSIGRRSAVDRRGPARRQPVCGRIRIPGARLIRAWRGFSRLSNPTPPSSAQPSHFGAGRLKRFQSSGSSSFWRESQRVHPSSAPGR